MNDYFTKFIEELSRLCAQQDNRRFLLINEVDMETRSVRITMRDRISDMRLARFIPFDYISTQYPEGQARNLIQIMQAEMEEATMMSVEEAIDQLEDLESDVWSGARDGRPIYVSDDDFRALQVAIEALKEKLG